jgi:hypothetical protein
VLDGSHPRFQQRVRSAELAVEMLYGALDPN